MAQAKESQDGRRRLGQPHCLPPPSLKWPDMSAFCLGPVFEGLSWTSPRYSVFWGLPLQVQHHIRQHHVCARDQSMAHTRGDVLLDRESTGCSSTRWVAEQREVSASGSGTLRGQRPAEQAVSRARAYRRQQGNHVAGGAEEGGNLRNRGRNQDEQQEPEQQEIKQTSLEGPR